VEEEEEEEEVEEEEEEGRERRYKTFTIRLWTQKRYGAKY
jgi:hypothetical protein